MNRFFLRPGPVVFVSNACVMILELVAGRLLAPNIGVSLHTWTGIIGVIFAGMSIGNYLGGRMADRFASWRTLGLLFLLAGAGALFVLGASALLAGMDISALPALPLLVRVLLFVSLVFLPPAVLLGTITPFVVKLTVRDLGTTGASVGRIYAASALGSIFGTFATGYVLVFYLGVRTIVLLVALTLIGLGALTGDWLRREARAGAPGATAA
jgi:MFS family permease